MNNYSIAETKPSSGNGFALTKVNTEFTTCVWHTVALPSVALEASISNAALVAWLLAQLDFA